MLARSLLQISSITSPKDITGCVLWLDAADSSTITESGGAISQWNDKSASGFNVTQGVAGNKPSYQSAIQNGKNVVRCDGGDYLANTSATLLRAVAGWSIFVVVKTTQNTATAIPIGILGLTTVRAHIGLNVTTGYGFAGGRRGNADTAAYAIDTTQAQTTSFYSQCGIGDFTNTDCTLFINGAQTAINSSWLTSGNSDNNGGTFNVGANIPAGQYWSGDIAEIIVYNSALGTVNRQLVEQYLKNKWGL